MKTKLTNNVGNLEIKKEDTIEKMCSLSDDVVGKKCLSEGNDANRWCRLILVRTIGFFCLKNLGYSVKYVTFLFLAHHNKHAHALAETVDALLTPE